MLLSPDDAKSDVILAAATLLFGNFALAIVAQLPFYPTQGVIALVLSLAWIVLLTMAVPWWLSRYRGDGIAAFGLQGDRGAIGTGVVLAVPLVIAQIIGALYAGLTPIEALLGTLGVLSTANIGEGQGTLLLIYQIARFVLLTIGATLVIGFLATRSREGFPRSPDTSLTELVRTFGMGAAGVALLTGLLRSLGAPSPVFVLLNVGALVAVVLIADRRIPTRTVVPRATVVMPAIIVVVVHIFASGGFFRGDLLSGLYTGAMGAGIAVVMSALVQLRGVAWAIVPMMIAAHWWATTFSPLAL